MIYLSAKWAKDLVSQPETGMGYQIVTVFLRDGRQFDKVSIVGGSIASVDGYSDVPFAEPDIDKIVVTHNRTK
jgi:hypothetical protein